MIEKKKKSTQQTNSNVIYPLKSSISLKIVMESDNRIRKCTNKKVDLHKKTKKKTFQFKAVDMATCTVHAWPILVTVSAIRTVPAHTPHESHMLCTLNV